MQDFFNRLQLNLSRLNSESNQTAVKDGKRIGAARSSSDNMVSKTVVSKNEKEAKTQRRYEESLLGQLTEDLTEEEVDEVVDKYIKQIADEIFEGL